MFSVCFSTQWEDDPEANVEKKVPNAWNLLRLSESGIDDLTADESDYLTFMADGGVTPATCRAYLAHWNGRRSDLGQISGLTDQQIDSLSQVLDEFDEFINSS